MGYKVGKTAHHTNNYAEISIRLFKVNVLDLVKAYNIVALLEFVIYTMKFFYKRELKEFFNSRDRKNQPFLQKVLKRTNYIQKQISKLLANIYMKYRAKIRQIKYMSSIVECVCVVVKMDALANFASM